MRIAFTNHRLALTVALFAWEKLFNWPLYVPDRSLPPEPSPPATPPDSQSFRFSQTQSCQG